jgi:hypothetical protein
VKTEYNIVAWLQAHIERLHGTETTLDVEAYVVDRETWQAIPGAREGLPEQFFVLEAQDEVELALYIAPEVLARLQEDHPHERLHDGNLESFCIALEGVSHFVFVAARAQGGRPVSALELEIQAEVDKFVSAWLLLQEQGLPLSASAPPLLRQLFAAYELREAVPQEEVDRYHVASRVAQRFCGGLLASYGRDQDGRRIERAVQRFVRQELTEKLRAA